ncbi:uncharacterized protein [Drosophila takahashii]|uniref:uncharacterized protein n=1 Tax=Drosophila takahashii TaxID=29030 RepID=UPI00389936BC
MSKRNWQRNKCSVHLPRSEFVEIQPMMSEEGPSSSGSGSGPQMTVETLSPVPEMPPHTLKENTTANKVNETVTSDIFPRDPRLRVRESSTTVSEWDESLLPSSKPNNKENKDHHKNRSRHLTGTTPKPKLDGMGEGWRGLSQDASLYKNHNIPMQPSKNSSDDDLTDRTNGAIKKKSQKPTGKTLKRSHSSNLQIEDDKPRGSGNATLLNNPDFKIKTENQPSHSVGSNLSSDDLVYHQNLDNKIFVKTVMPKFFSNFQISNSKDVMHKDSKSLQTQLIAPQTSDEDFLFLENQDNKLVVETLMPQMMQRAPKWTEKEDMPSTSKDGKAVKENVWHKDNLCEVSLQEIMNPAAPPSCVEKWRSIEAICMRLRGIEVPGNVGLLEETPTFEELFEVLSIEDPAMCVPKRKTNRRVKK